jgi:hypothetical protein
MTRTPSASPRDQRRPTLRRFRLFVRVAEGVLRLVGQRRQPLLKVSVEGNDLPGGSGVEVGGALLLGQGVIVGVVNVDDALAAGGTLYAEGVSSRRDATCRWAGSRGSAGFLLAAKVRISLSGSILGALKNFGLAAEKVFLCRRLRRGASA